MKVSTVATTIVLPALLMSAATFGASRAQDSTRLDQLEKRVDGMDTKLDALINLMTKQKGNSPPGATDAEQTSTQQAPAPSTQADNLQPGLNLDIYSIVIGPHDKIPASPTGFAAASQVVDWTQPFNLGGFERIDGLSQYARPTGKSIGQLYSGNVRFSDSGDYVFQATLSKKGTGYPSANKCATSVIVDDTTVTTTYTNVSNFPPASSSENGSVKLQGGIHKVALWSICNSFGYDSRLEVEIAVKEPKDRTPKPIEASRFLVER